MHVSTKIISMAVSAESTPTFFVGNARTLSVYIPAVVANFGGGTQVITLRGAPREGVDTKACNIMSAGAVGAAVLSAATGGVYTFDSRTPIPPYVALQFSTAVTQAVTIEVIYPGYGN